MSMELDVHITESTKETEQNQEVNLAESPRASSSKSSIDLCFQDSLVQNAEIRWALKQILSGYSDNSCKDMVVLFQTLFPDSEISKKMRLEPNKLKYIINHGIAPYVKESLLDEVKKSDHFVTSFDE